MTEKYDITITDRAFAKALAIYQKHRAILKISVEGGGCAGFAYKYSTTTDLSNDDILFEKNGARIIINTLDAQYVRGSVIDFIDTLGTKHFDIKNPKAIAKCGCGNSFDINI